MRGSEFASHLAADITKREEQVLDAIREGWAYVQWVPLDITVGGHHVTVVVTADAFAIGNRDDFFRPALTATTLQKVADLLGAMLPTSKISDVAHDQAAVHIEPITRPPTAAMGSTAWMADQNHAIDAAMGARRGSLISSVGKDWVLTPRLVGRPDRSANYGWHSSKAPLFGPSGHRVYQSVGLAHNRWHVDYSQMGRLVLRRCVVDGFDRDLGEVLRDPVLHVLVSDEGPIKIDRIPDDGPSPARPAAASQATVRRGSTGPVVVLVQKIVGATADGIFGPGTERAVKIWQAAHGLVADGIFGPKSWAAAEQPKEPIVNEKIKFVQARNYKVAHGRAIDLVVLHTMEAAEKPTTAEAVASWFGGASAPMASAHFCVDNDSVVQCVLEKDIAYAAPGANTNGVHIEMTGYAKQSAEDWADEFSRAMLERTAGLVADICKTHDVPIVFVTADELLAGERGVTTHAAVSKAFKKSDHYDPGPSFPMADFLERVRELAAT